MKTFIVKHKLKLVAVALVVAGGLSFFLLKSPEVVPQGQEIFTAQAAAAGEKKPAWTIRCTAGEGDPARECEAFQRLVMAKTGQRVAEFAVGFPKDKKEGRGVIVLPLGVLLEDGMAMQVDGGQKYQFKPRYCTNEGCFSFINLDPALLDALKQGKVAELSAKAMNGKDVKIKMTLEGLAEALDIAAASAS